MKNNNYNELKNDKVKKRNLKNYIIVLLLIFTLLSVSFMIYAWAKYTTGQNKEATADVAKWSFKVISNGVQSEDNINLSITRTDNNRNN